MICLTRSYNAPTAWYGVDRPVALGAGISPLLVAGRRKCCVPAVVLCEPGARGGRTGCDAERATTRLRRARLSAAAGRRAPAGGRPGRGGGGAVDSCSAVFYVPHA